MSTTKTRESVKPPTMKTRSNTQNIFANAYEPHFSQDRETGKWRLSFSYANMTINVDINRDLGSNEVEYQVFCWIDGERLVFETRAQCEVRHDLIRSNERPFEQVYNREPTTEVEFAENDAMMDKTIEHSDAKHALFPSYERGIMERVEECLKRWDAICMLVSPHVSMG